MPVNEFPKVFTVKLKINLIVQNFHTLSIRYIYIYTYIYIQVCVCVVCVCIEPAAT